MSLPSHTIIPPDPTRRKVFAIVGVVTAVLIIGVIYMTTRQPLSGTAEQPRLEGALRAGSPEFEQARGRVVIQFNPDEDATEAPRPLGDIVMHMTPTVRNFTGRTITGLELHAVVVDLAGQPIRERTVIAIPARQAQLEPNRVLKVPIMMEGFKKEDTRANVKIEMTGLRFAEAR